MREINSSTERTQYNPFHKEDQLELQEIRQNRLNFNSTRLYRQPNTTHFTRYESAQQHDLEGQLGVSSLSRHRNYVRNNHSDQGSSRISEDIEVNEFLERDIQASSRCRQLFCLSTLIVISQVS